MVVFKILTRTSERLTVNMAGKNTLKSVKLPDMKVIFWNLTKI